METKSNKRVSPVGGTVRIFARSVQDVTANKTNRTNSSILSPSKSNENNPNIDQECINDSVESSSNHFAELLHGQDVDNKDITLSQTPTTSKTLNRTKSENSQLSQRSIISQLNENTEINDKEKCTTIKVTLKTIVDNDQIDSHVNPPLESKHLKPISVPKKKSLNKELSTHKSKSTETKDTSHDKPQNLQKVKVKNKVSKNNSHPKDKVKTKSPIHGNIENSKPRTTNYPRRWSTSSNNSNDCSKDIRISNRKSCGFNEGYSRDKQTYSRKGSFKDNSTYTRNTSYPRWVQNKDKSEGEDWNLELMEIVPVPGKDQMRSELLTSKRQEELISHKKEMLALSSGEESMKKIDNKDKLKALNCINTNSIKIRSVSESCINMNNDDTNFTVIQDKSQNSALEDWSEKADKSGSLKTLNWEDSQSNRIRCASESGVIINNDSTNFTTSQNKTQNSAPEDWSEKANESGSLKTLNCKDIQSIKIRCVSESDLNLNNDTGRLNDFNQDKTKNVAPEDWFKKGDELEPMESLKSEDIQSTKVISVGESNINNDTSISNFISHEDVTQNYSPENWSKNGDELGSVTILNCDVTSSTLNQDNIHNSTASDLSKQAGVLDSVKTLDTEGTRNSCQPQHDQSKRECTINSNSPPNDLSNQADVPVPIKSFDTEGSQEFCPPSPYTSQTRHTMNDNSISFTEKQTCSDKNNTTCSNSASEDWSKEIIVDLGQPSSFDPFPDKNGNVPAENNPITELEPDNCNLSKQIVNINDNSDQSLVNIEVTDDNLNDNVTGATDSDSVIYLQECQPPENRKLRPIHARGGIQPPTSCRRKAYSASDDDGKIKPHPLSVYFDEDWCKLQLEAKKETENPNTETQKTPHVLDGNVESRYSQDYRKNQFIKEQQPTVDVAHMSPTKPFSPQSQSSSLKRGSRNQKEDTKVLPIRTDKSIDEELKKLDESFGFRRSKSHYSSDKRQDYQRNKFKPQNIRNNRSELDSEDWTSELLEVPAISSTKIKDDSQEWPKSDTCMETYVTVDNFDNRNSDMSEQYEINKNEKASLHVHQTENRTIVDSDLKYCEYKKSNKVSNIVHDSATVSSSAYNSESSVAVFSDYHNTNRERKHEKEKMVIDDVSPVRARSQPSKCSSPLKRKDAKMLSSNIDISNIAISDDISDYSSIVSDNDVEKSVQTYNKTFKIPDSEDIGRSQRHCVSSDSHVSPKDKKRKQFSPERIAAVMSTCSSSTELNKHSSNYSPSRQPSRDSGFYGKYGPAPEHCDYNFYQHGKPPVFDPRMFNPYLQAPGNWMPFYPYSYMCPPYYPCEYDLSSAQNPMKEERENHSNKKTEIIPQEMENKSQDIRKIKAEEQESGKSGGKDEKPEMDLCSLITVPLSEISDLEQAKNLLHYVKNSVSRLTGATGFYYQASVEHHVPVLHVGATTNKKSSESEQKTKPCRSHSSEIGREKEKNKRRQTRRNSSTSPDARCTGNRNNQSQIYTLSQSPDSGKRPVEFLSSPPSTYHYQPRYPIPESLLHHGSPPKPQSYPGHPRFQHQGFTLPDFDSYDSSRNYRNNCDVYVNQDSTKMNEVRSSNSSIVSYDLTDEDDSYNEDDGFKSQAFGRETKNILDSDGDITEFDPHKKVRSTDCGSAYNEEFPELSKQSGKSKPPVTHRFVEKKGKRRLCEPPSDQQFRKENNPVTCCPSDLDKVVQSINNRYVPPHKRRFSEDSESYSRSFTKFGQLNDFNPNRSRQNYENNSRRSSDQCAGGDVRDISLNRNWSRNLVAADVLSSNSNRYECTSDPYAKPSFQADKGQYQQNFDTKTFVNSFYVQHERRSSESNSSSSYSSRLQYDNRLRSNNGVMTPANWKFRLNQRCQYYKSTFVDTHCHLDFLFERLNFNGSYKDFKEKYSDSFPQNFEGCISIFCNPKSFKHSGLWMTFAEEDNVWMAMGCHPKHASFFDPIAEENLKFIIEHPKIIAVGEIGLDYSGYHSKFEAIQKVVFTRQLKLCLTVKKPLIIHCRDAEDDCLKIMEEIIPKNYKIHCHCFTGSYEQAKRWLEMFPNLYLGITPVVTYSSATASHDLARKIPLNRLLLETDSPYFVPRNLSKEEHKVSLPGFAIVVAEEVARYQDITVEQVLIQCRQNTKTLFDI